MHPSRPCTVLLTGLVLVAGSNSHATEGNPPPPPKSDTAVAPVVLPSFQPGWWEYKRTTTTGGGRVSPQVATVRKCTDPSAELKQKLAELKQKGCQFAPMSQQGNQYHSTWTCPAEVGAVAFHSVVTVTDSGSYQDQSEMHFGRQINHSTIEARRLGACPPATQAHHQPLGVVNQ